LFDVEDYTSPESVGMDDIPMRLAEIMTEEEVTGTFFVIGEKARSLRDRGRADVIDAMSKHDIGLHTNFGSIHPTITEILEDKSWEEGIKIMKENEYQGFDDLQEIFGKEVIPFARHGGSYGTQLIAALGQIGANYVYSPIGLPGHNATWFCNTLNIYGVGDYYIYDDVFSNDQKFDSLQSVFGQKFPELIDGLDVVSFFAGHPSKMRSVQFWDINYYYGANPDSTEWVTPELRPEESMETVYRNFRKLLQFLKTLDYVELTTYSEIIKEFSNQRDQITRDELTEVAQMLLEGKQMVFLDHYSWAEIFYALSFSLSNTNKNEEMPVVINLTRPYGPMQTPDENSNVAELTAEKIRELAFNATEYINEKNHLPDRLSVDNLHLGTRSLLGLFSQYYIDVLSQENPSSISLVPIAGFPEENVNMILNEVKGCKDWPVHRNDLDMTEIIAATKRQLWTLKPAITNGSISN